MLKMQGSRGLQLATDIAGNSNNPPVLLFHGGGQTRHAWGEAIAVLAEEGYFAVTVDLRGHGDSDWSETNQYELTHFAADVAALCARFSQTPILVGASLGGLAALLAAGQEAPNIAKGLVLVDIVPKVNMQGAKLIQQFMAASPDGFGSLEEAADAISAYIPHRKRPDNLNGLQKNLRQRNDGRYYWHWDPGFIDASNFVNPQTILEQAASRLDIPVMLVRGEKSDVVDDEGVRDFQRLIPHAEYVKVAGAAHMIAGDSNQQFNQVVLDFLRKTH